MSKSVSSYFRKKKKKFIWPLSLEGKGAKGLSGRSTKKRTFFAASLRTKANDNEQYSRSWDLRIIGRVSKILYKPV